jgi:hypothetical protein
MTCATVFTVPTDITCATLFTELPTSRALLCSPNYRHHVRYCVHWTADITCATLFTELPTSRALLCSLNYRHHVRYFVHWTTDITCATVFTELPTSRALLCSLNYWYHVRYFVHSILATLKRLRQLTAAAQPTSHTITVCSGDIGPHGADSIKVCNPNLSVHTRNAAALTKG